MQKFNEWLKNPHQFEDAEYAARRLVAAGMDPESIARDFGGRLAFYGGVDCQRLLTFGTPDEVRTEVGRNVRAFAQCGGYVVSNAHCHIANIRGENVEAMIEAARDCTF